MSEGKVLITGASGFLGSHICEVAHEQGYQVYALVRKASSRQWLKHDWLKIHEVDYNDMDSISSLLSKADYVIHCAGVLGTTSRNERDSRRTNITLTRIVAQESAKAGVKRFVYVSSLAAGGPGKGPQARNEDFPDNPVSHYGRSKKDAELMLASMSTLLSVVSLRYGTIYGPGDRNILGFFKAVSSRFVPLIGGKKIFCNSMVYIEDAARAALAALTAEVKSGSVYYITDGNPYPLPKLYDYIEEALDKPVKSRRIGIPFWMAMVGAWWLHDIIRKRGLSPEQVRMMRALYWFASPDKAIRELDWKPKVCFREGLRRTVVWYHENGWL